MNDQAWNNPGALAGAAGAEEYSLQEWVDLNLNRALSTRQFSDALVQFDPSERLELLEDAHEYLRAGWPGVPFGSVMDHAAFWADMASHVELKAYTLVCFERLSAEEQAAFLAYVQRKQKEC